MIRVSAAIFCASSLFAAGVQAQQVQLPAACQSFLEAPDAEMKQMTAKLEGQMRDMHAKMQRMGDTQKGLHDAMMRMHGPMMDGMMAKDSDVAWICSMIPHHQAAIVMAEAGLKGSDNAESRKLAEETITSQRKEISRLVSWLRKHAESESRNEVKRGTGK